MNKDRSIAVIIARDWQCFRVHTESCKDNRRFTFSIYSNIRCWDRNEYIYISDCTEYLIIQDGLRTLLWFYSKSWNWSNNCKWMISLGFYACHSKLYRNLDLKKIYNDQHKSEIHKYLCIEDICGLAIKLRIMQLIRWCIINQYVVKNRYHISYEYEPSYFV